VGSNRVVAFGFAALALVAGCSSSSTSSTKVEPCKPGEALSCVAQSGCDGEKFCKADGNGFGDCECRDGSAGTGGSGGGSGGGGAAGAVGGSDAGTACGPDETFGAPLLVPGINDNAADESAARLLPDELTAVFSSTRDGDWDVYQSTRGNALAPFATTNAITEVNSLNADWDPTITGDGLTLYFGSARPNDVSVAIYVATRNTPVGVFGTPEPVAGLLPAGAAYAKTPYVTPSGGALYYVIVDLALPQEDIGVARKAGSGGFTNPRKLSELNTPSADSFPVVSPDERVIYYASLRSDGGARGGWDIWMAQRPNGTDPFGPPRNLAELNSGDWEKPTEVSELRPGALV
jgi:hypothetical protein